MDRGERMKRNWGDFRRGRFWIGWDRGAINRPRVIFDRQEEVTVGLGYGNSNSDAVVVTMDLPYPQDVIRDARAWWVDLWKPMDWSGPLTRGWKRTPREAFAQIGRDLSKVVSSFGQFFRSKSGEALLASAIRVQEIKTAGHVFGMDQAKIDEIISRALEGSRTSTLPFDTVLDAVWTREKEAWLTARDRAKS